MHRAASILDLNVSCSRVEPAPNPQVRKHHRWTEYCRLLTCFNEARASNGAFFRDSNFREISLCACGSGESTLTTAEAPHCGADGETVSLCSFNPCRNCVINESDWTWASHQNQHDVMEETELLYMAVHAYMDWACAVEAEQQKKVQYSLMPFKPKL